MEPNIRRAESQKKMSHQSLLEAEHKLTELLEEVTVGEHNLKTVTSEGDDLLVQIERKREGALRMNHASSVELDGLKQIVKEKILEELTLLDILLPLKADGNAKI